MYIYRTKQVFSIGMFFFGYPNSSYWKHRSNGLRPCMNRGDGVWKPKFFGGDKWHTTLMLQKSWTQPPVWMYQKSCKIMGYQHTNLNWFFSGFLNHQQVFTNHKPRWNVWNHKICELTVWDCPILTWWDPGFLKIFGQLWKWSTHVNWSCCFFGSFRHFKPSIFF